MKHATESRRIIAFWSCIKRANGKAARYLVSAAITVAMAAESSGASGSNELSLIDPVRVAFYEVAPPVISASMSEAAKEECSHRSRRNPDQSSATVKSETDWLCSGEPLHFLRGVDVLGNKQKIGFICSKKRVTPNLKFYTEDMFMDNEGCIFVSFNVKTKKHLIDR